MIVTLSILIVNIRRQWNLIFTEQKSYNYQHRITNYQTILLKESLYR